MIEAVKASGTELVTVALRRFNTKQKSDDLLSPLLKLRKLTLMPNTSGARTAEEAVKVAMIARELSGSNFIKLEIHPNPHHLLPDPIETFAAAKELVRKGFTVLPYMPADPVLAKRLEDIGIKALTVHCRTRCQGHGGDADWSWIPKIKEVVKIPVIVNGGIFTAHDAKKAFDETGADGVMVARGAIDHPWIFREIKELLSQGFIENEVDVDERIQTALRHLRYEVEYKEMKRAVIPFRKYYTGYLKGLYNSSKIRQELMKHEEYKPIEEILLGYLEFLKNHAEIFDNL